jgi:hypothetical protein
MPEDRTPFPCHPIPVIAARIEAGTPLPVQWHVFVFSGASHVRVGPFADETAACDWADGLDLDGASVDYVIAPLQDLTPRQIDPALLSDFEAWLGGSHGDDAVEG